MAKTSWEMINHSPLGSVASLTGGWIVKMMADNSSAIIEGANERIKVVENLVANFDTNSVRKNRNTDLRETAPKFGADGIPIKLREAINDAVDSIFSALTASNPCVECEMARQPPKWWSDAKSLLLEEGDKNPAARRLLDTFLAFEPYINEKTPTDLLNFIIIAHDRDVKIIYISSRHGFRAVGQPHPEKTTVLFDPQIDDYVRRSLQKATGETLAFPQRCDLLLFNALKFIDLLIK